MLRELVGPRLMWFWVIAFLLASCGQAVLPTPQASLPATEAPAAFPSPGPEHTSPPLTATPSAVARPLHHLTVVYGVQDEIWLWTGGISRLVLRREGIWRPRLSHDGQWVTFLEEAIRPDGVAPERALWVVRADGTQLHRLVSPEDLAAFDHPDTGLWLNDFDWMPDRNEVLFNTNETREGPPGFWPAFDLHRVNLSGDISHLAGPGQGGRFFPSPDGRYVAVASTSRIGLISLEGANRRTLLDFAPLLRPCECYYIPEVFWDPQSRYVFTSIPPANMFLAHAYNGEPEQVWRLSLDGSAQVIGQVAPMDPLNTVVRLAPGLERFLYLAPAPDTCNDLSGLYLYDAARPPTGAPLNCGGGLPEWAPDGEHFLLHLQGQWQLVSINDEPPITLPFLDPSIDPQITWIDDAHFIVVQRGHDHCSLSLAGLDGIIADIIVAGPDDCPTADSVLSGNQ